MKCHYEILDVPRDADLGEIKSAYRKAALKWHPDKNLNNPEGAKEQFQLVQQAYEVLSDPQERAWYDKHREQILRGANSEFQDNSLDVFQYFTTTCFKGYGDDEKGFYTVYRNVFDQIIKEDLEFIDDKHDFCDIPRFGDSKSDYDDVVGPFYSYWSSYCTKKSYVWLDPYDIKEIRDRRVFKLVEKENKKVRQKAKKERNEEVRNLVAFVRKRDKRVQAHTKLMEAKVLENRQKQEELSKQKRLERKKQLNESTQAEWAKFDNVKSQLEEIEKNLAEEFGEEFSDSDEEIEEVNDLYCVACNKIFKTPKALENHEASKKHKENIERLREIMLEEEENEDSNGFKTDGEELTENEEHSDVSVDREKKNKKAVNSDEEVNGEFTENEEHSDASVDRGKKMKKKNKKAKNVLSVNNDEVNGDLTENNEHSDASVDRGKKTKKKNKKPKNILSVHNDEEVNEELDVTKIDSDDNFDFEASKKQKKKNKKQNKRVTESKNEENQATPEVVSKNKKKQNKKEKQATNLEEIDTSHCCVTCKSSFQSKNKLFEHLKSTGHGVYLPKNVKKKKSVRED